MYIFQNGATLLHNKFILKTSKMLSWKIILITPYFHMENFHIIFHFSIERKDMKILFHDKFKLKFSPIWCIFPPLYRCIFLYFKFSLEYFAESFLKLFIFVVVVLVLKVCAKFFCQLGPNKKNLLKYPGTICIFTILFRGIKFSTTWYHN